MKKRFFNSHASMIRCLLIVLTMVFLNILFIWSGFLKTDNVLTPVSRVVVHYSGVIFISIGGLILCYETYINKSSSRKISLGILASYLSVFVESRFIIEQKFDAWFWILIVAIIVLQATLKSSKKCNNEEDSDSYSPITLDGNLFKSRRRQQDYLFNLVKNEGRINNGMSICIAGKWGSGKTSFVNTVIDRLKNENIGFEEIRINAFVAPRLHIHLLSSSWT